MEKKSYRWKRKPRSWEEKLDRCNNNSSEIFSFSLFLWPKNYFQRLFLFRSRITSGIPFDHWWTVSLVISSWDLFVHQWSYLQKWAREWGPPLHRSLSFAAPFPLVLFLKEEKEIETQHNTSRILFFSNIFFRNSGSILLSLKYFFFQ